MRCQKCLYNIYTESMAHSPSSTWVPLDSWSHWNLQVILSYINPTTDCENTSTAPIKSEPLQIVPVSCNHYYMCLTTGCMWNRYSSCNCERTPLVEHKNKTSTLGIFPTSLSLQLLANTRLLSLLHLHHVSPILVPRTQVHGCWWELDLHLCQSISLGHIVVKLEAQPPIYHPTP